MGIVNSNDIEETASVQRFVAEVSAGDYSGLLSALTLNELTPAHFLAEFSKRRFLNVPMIPAESGVYQAVLSSQVVNNIFDYCMADVYSKESAESVNTVCRKREYKDFFRLHHNS